MTDDSRHDEVQSDVSSSETLDIKTVIQLQQSEYHHLQSKARGALGLSVALIAITITAVSAFYTPLPSIPTEIDYASLLDVIPVTIGPIVASLTIGMSLLLSMIYAGLTVISISISVSNNLDAFIPQNRLNFVTVSNSEHRSWEDVRSFKNNINRIEEKYIRGTLRLIIAILAATASFLVYSHTVSLDLWYLFWFHAVYFVPSVIWTAFASGIMDKPPSEEGEERVPLLLELLIGDGPRLDYITARRSEKLLLSLGGIISFTVVVTWIVSIFYHAS